MGGAAHLPCAFHNIQSLNEVVLLQQLIQTPAYVNCACDCNFVALNFPQLFIVVSAEFDQQNVKTKSNSNFTSFIYFFHAFFASKCLVTTLAAKSDIPVGLNIHCVSLHVVPNHHHRNRVY